MRKILLTSVGVAALAVSANATDFTLSGSSLLNIDDQGDTAAANQINVGVSKTFDNGMALSLNQNLSAAAAGSEMTLTTDAISVTFGDYDQNEKNPGLNGNAAAADISGDGVSNAADNVGAVSLGATMAGVGIGASMNAAGDTMFGGSMTTDMGGMAVTIGGDVHSDNTSSADQTALGVSATMGNLVVVANSVQNEATSGNVDITTYSAAYTAGGLVIGFQGSDANTSAYSATYTIVPGMQFEIGSEDNGTATTSSAQLQMTF